jgi:hypothetical protein
VPQRLVHKLLAALLCAAAVFAAGCHGPSNISYYGIAWISVTDEPGDYAAYIVNIDAITLTRSDGVVVAAAGTPERVDLTQVKNYSELWSAESIPDGTYVSATITMDYTDADISVIVDGVPQAAATLVDYYTPTTTPTTYSITVNFDAAHQPTITPTYASTSAVLISLDFDLAASGYVDLSTTPATVHVRPIVSVGMLAPDTKLIRVRGPLINSSTNVDTYTVDIRPFYDEANNLGTVTLFNQPSTVFTLNGQSYVGNSGLAALSVLSAGITMTAGFTTFQPDYNPLNGATAGRFNLAYVVAGSTLEDTYTNGVSGDVVARDGNTLTLQGATLILNTADTFEFENVNTQVLLGSGTIVTADDNSDLTNLGIDSIAVGQHITARGTYTTLGPPAVLDATGTTSQNTGSVRLQPSQVWGTLVSSTSGTATLDAQYINDWPVSDFTFTGNGATAPSPSAFVVNTALTGLPADVVAGDPLWLSGYLAPFGTAPPDFTAFSANDQLGVQVAGAAVASGLPTTPGNGICGTGSQVCIPALLSVIWNPADKVSAPFTSVSAAGFTVNPSASGVLQAVIRIGPELIDLTSSSVTSPMVVATSLPATNIFAPRFMVGNPVTATSTATIPVTTVVAFDTYSNMADFVTTLQSGLSATTPALQLAARGVYDATTNTFTATSIDFVL